MSFGHLKARATRILATHCCICSRELVDAKSTELGVGPVCRKRYYGDPDIETTEEMLESALGALVVSKVDPEVIDECLRHKGNARKVCNILVYHASANYTDKEFVLSVTPVIRLIGYTSLADKLEKTRSTVKIVKTPDDQWVHMFAPRNDTVQWGLRKIGARMIRHEASRRFKCWSIPSERKLSLAVLLGVGFGGEYCHVVPADGGETKTYKIEPKTWSDFEATLPKPKPTPKPAGLPAASTKGIFVEDKGKHFILHTPFDWAFVTDIRKISGRRYHGGDANSFPVSQRDKVTDLVKQHYGVAL